MKKASAFSGYAADKHIQCKAAHLSEKSDKQSF